MNVTHDVLQYSICELLLVSSLERLRTTLTVVRRYIWSNYRKRNQSAPLFASTCRKVQKASLKDVLKFAAMLFRASW
jgi:hypothetical protein